MASNLLAAHLGLGMEDSGPENLSTRDHLKEAYIAARRWPEADALAVEELRVRRPMAQHEGDDDVIAALRSLEAIAKGMGDLDKAAHIGREVGDGCRIL